MDKGMYKILQDNISELNHPCLESLLEILSGSTGLSTGGYPFIGVKAYNRFLNSVPHLFLKGKELIDWIISVEQTLSARGLTTEPFKSVSQSLSVLKNMVFSAAITAPPDLWLIRQVVSDLKELGVIDFLDGREQVTVDEVSQALELNSRLLESDFKFLYSRSLLLKKSKQYALTALNSVKELSILEREVLQANWVGLFASHISQKASLSREIEQYCELGSIDHELETKGWIASGEELELGYKILPLVLALRVLDLCSQLKNGTALSSRCSEM